jgi:hypothetical protein
MALLLLVGCKSGDQSARRVPSDLRIVFGYDGTFAGRSMGYSINALGEVVRWEGKYPEEVVEATARVDRKHVERLWRRAEEIDFLKMQEQAMATVNSFITVSARADSRRVTWVNRDETALTPVQEFFDECMSVAKAAFDEEATPPDAR